MKLCLTFIQICLQNIQGMTFKLRLSLASKWRGSFIVRKPLTKLRLNKTQLASLTKLSTKVSLVNTWEIVQKQAWTCLIITNEVRLHMEETKMVAAIGCSSAIQSECSCASLRLFISQLVFQSYNSSIVMFMVTKGAKRVSRLIWSSNPPHAKNPLQSQNSLFEA